MKTNLYKKNSIKNKKVLSAAFALLFSFALSDLHPQQPVRTIDLKNQEPSWQAVIGGEAVSPCIETSYGIALISDGRMLSACTGSGTVIWQHSIRGKPSPFISAFGDFLYVVTDSSKLNFLNPSGITLWTSNCQFPVINPPVPGLDGRVFVQGKKQLACYGLDGKRRWKKETAELSPLPVCTLDDGSLLAFLNEPKNNQTIAHRYSPFGKLLEEVSFAGIVSCAENTPKGVLVALKNGSIGLVNIKGEEANTQWVQGSGNTSGAFKICYSKNTDNASFFFQSGSRTEALIIETDSGEILNRFQVGNIASNFQTARATESGYFISGSYTACEFDETGKILYAANLPPSSGWNSLFYNNKNYIIICMKDWTIKAFLMNQTTKSAFSGEHKHDEKISYIKALDYDSEMIEAGIRPLTIEKMAEIADSLKKGDYGAKEKEYLELIKTEADFYLNANIVKAQNSDREGNFFAENAVWTQNLLYLMSKTGTREFSEYFARLISSELDLSQILSIITFAGKAGYDEDGLTLASLENLLMTRLSSGGDTVLLKAICDATYDICLYMGRPALNRRGKNILTHMLFPSYDKSVQTYARKTLEKMVKAGF